MEMRNYEIKKLRQISIFSPYFSMSCLFILDPTMYKSQKFKRNILNICVGWKQTGKMDVMSVREFWPKWFHMMDFGPYLS